MTDSAAAGARLPANGSRRSGPAQMGPDTRREFLRDERFRHVVVGPGFQPGNHVEAGLLRCDDDDRDVAGLADRPADVEPAVVGQLQVHEHERRLDLREAGQPVGRVRRLRDVVPLILEDHTQHEPHVVVVLDGEQTCVHWVDPVTA
jgi:hypothetical protein